MPRRLLAAVAAIVLVAGQAGSALGAASATPGSGGPATAAPIQKGLLQDLGSGKVDKFVVEFASKADLTAASKVKGHTARGKAVLDALTATSRKSQAAAMALAQKANIKAKSYWLYNEMIVHGTAKQAEQFAKIKGVTLVRAEKIYPLIKPVPSKIVAQAVGDPEWGVEKIRAPEAWAEGVLGQGVVVASVDTGVDFTHPALVNQYRGNNGDGTFTHDYNWWDGTGTCGGEPCDDVGHGTHTMGTMVGGDGPGPFTPDVGVAPGARWIAAKGCAPDGCPEDALLSSGQFILAPTDLNGENPDPSKRPDVVNNSWGGGPGDPFYMATVQAWRAAGIIPVFSSGNPGPFCGEGGSPGDFNEVFSVGATDINDKIASFSGRGPSFYGKINPDVVAPGVNVTSSVPGGGYEAFDGTSMAAPHVTGTIALALSAKPVLLGNLANYGPITDAIRDTAIDHPDDTCGGDEDGDPNNVYGDGRIDAKAAVDKVASGGTLSGTVTDLDTSAPIAGATITAANGTGREFSAVTDVAGNYSLFLAEDSYVVTADAFGYVGDVASGVEIHPDSTTDQDFALDALPRFVVSGHVRASEDGSPLPDATVKAIGTPVPAAVTDAAGAYSLTLPVGDYSLRASSGGCTEVGEADISVEDHDITQDFALFRKLDDFGHGCRPIPFDWVDAPNQTALYGDEFVGRLHLPFSFSFYGKSYSEIWLADNGYVNFLGPDQFNFQPSAIPSPATPNAAIYPLWSDLAVDNTSSIDQGLVGSSPNRAFVLEFASMQVLGSSAHVSFEIKLWEDGRIDLLYGNNPADPGDGRNATIGIENATGTDALQFSFLDSTLDANVAYRYEHVASGFVHGTVTDANDGEPISGAQITAAPGGRTATTDEDGNYSMRLRPGSYSLSASAGTYVPGSKPVVVTDGGDTTADFVLDAAIGSVDPTEVSATVDFGATTDVNVTLNSSGTAPLTWEAKERDQGATLPDLPPASVNAIWHTKWGPQHAPAGFPKTVINDTTPGPDPNAVLDTIITDPAGDSLDSNDVTTVRAGSDGTSLASIAIDFAPTTPMANVGGYMFLDTDQDPSTGLPAEAQFGLPAQDIGMEYFVDLFLANSDGVVFIIDANTFDLVAELGATVVDHTIRFDIPLDVINDTDGAINTALVVGQLGPSDWAPDEGHGTIQPFKDAPWLAADPASGQIDPGQSQVVTLHLGGAGITPGEYHAQVFFVTNAPKQSQLAVDVTLTVNLPAEFGIVNGVVTDAHSGEPLGGVAVALHATWKGSPLELTATTAADGSYTIVGPEGTWSTDYSLDGYVTATKNVTIVKGKTTSGADAAIHKDQPHAQLDGGPVVFYLTPGRTNSQTVTLSNPAGHEDLTFTIGEVDLGGGGAAIAAAPASRKLPAASNPSKRSTFGLTGRKSLALPPRLHATGDVLASWPATGLDLPWGVGYTGKVWISDPIDNGDLCSIAGTCTDTEFTTGGSPTGASFETTFGDWAGDMAYDAGRGLLWQVAVGGDNGLHGLDPSDGSEKMVITGDPWSSTSQRGVAYDPAADVFYVGGWNEGIIYRVAGPSWPTPGETLSQCNPADPNISGLAWNGSFQMLWEATNSDTDTIYLVDPATCDTVRGIDHPDGGGGGGAGIELDAVGNLWTVGQNSGNAYLIDSGLPNFSDVPWLSVAPTEGTIAPDGSTALSITADSTGLAPGVYRAVVYVQTNDPDNSSIQVPVVLVVPGYQQGVNAGGNAYVDPGTGDIYATDRAFTAGSFGYVGGSTRATGSAIGGTDRDALYKDQRDGMSAYRFAVPNGVYKVDLAFAEIQLKKAGGRVFNVSIEGAPVLSNLDVYAAAGANTAYDKTFIVEVTDGILDIGFAAQRGDKPIVNGILVTELPPGAPGN